jgi:predicted nucleic acid-binding protein
VEQISLEGLSDDDLLLIDSAPIIYFLEGHPKFGPRFAPLFEAHTQGRFKLAVTTITVVEVLTGPLQAKAPALARRYRSVLESWQTVNLDMEVAEAAARLRAEFRLKLADAVQAASAQTIGAAALVTHDRDYSRIKSLRIIS